MATGGYALAYDAYNRAVGIDGPLTPLTALGHLASTNAEPDSVGGQAQQTDQIGISRLGTTTYVREPDGRLLQQRGPSSDEWVLTDRLGSTAGLVTTNTLQRTYTYTYTPTGCDETSGSGPQANIRFAAGQHIDGLTRFGVRFYDPATGQWTQPDPLDQTADLRQANRYGYAAGDAVNWIDPSGLLSFGEVLDGVGAVAAIGGAAATCATATTGVGAFACGATSVGALTNARRYVDSVTD